jgi:hypothetical protein
MIAKILLQNSDDLRWIAVLMDKAPGEDALARVTPTSPERE